MGARAWTSGRDVYFGQGGFEPRIAAHELVHTVQQGAARGSVRQSVTPGTVQMWWPFSRKKSKFDKDVEVESLRNAAKEHNDSLFVISVQNKTSAKEILGIIIDEGIRQEQVFYYDNFMKVLY